MSGLLRAAVLACVTEEYDKYYDSDLADIHVAVEEVKGRYKVNVLIKEELYEDWFYIQAKTTTSIFNSIPAKIQEYVTGKQEVFDEIDF